MDQQTQNHYRPRIEKLLTELPAEADFDTAHASGNLGVATTTSAAASPLLLRQRQLDFALARIDGGYFGRCIRCGYNLPRALLDRDPAALVCGECPPTRRRAASAQRN